MTTHAPQTTLSLTPEVVWSTEAADGSALAASGVPMTGGLRAESRNDFMPLLCPSAASGCSPSSSPSSSSPTASHSDQRSLKGSPDGNLPDGSIRIASGSGYRYVTPFPWRLHELLCDDPASSAISWMDDGRCFRVHDPQRFIEDVAPTYFSHKSYKSFQRQLHLYGFERITSSQFKGAYYHPKFLKSDRNLTHQMPRIKAPSAKPRRTGHSKTTSKSKAAKSKAIRRSARQALKQANSLIEAFFEEDSESSVVVPDAPYVSNPSFSTSDPFAQANNGNLIASDDRPVPHVVTPVESVSMPSFFSRSDSCKHLELRKPLPIPQHGAINGGIVSAASIVPDSTSSVTLNQPFAVAVPVTSSTAEVTVCADRYSGASTVADSTAVAQGPKTMVSSDQGQNDVNNVKVDEDDSSAFLLWNRESGEDELGNDLNGSLCEHADEIMELFGSSASVDGVPLCDEDVVANESTVPSEIDVVKPSDQLMAKQVDTSPLSVGQQYSALASVYEPSPMSSSSNFDANEAAVSNDYDCDMLDMINFDPESDFDGTSFQNIDIDIDEPNLSGPPRFEGPYVSPASDAAFAPVENPSVFTVG